MEFWKESFETSPIKEKTDETPVKRKPVKKIKKKRNQLHAFILLIFLLAGVFVYLLWPRYELVALGSFGGQFGTAVAINNNGQIAGWAQFPAGESHAFLYDPNSKMKDLGTFGGKNSYAHDLNDKGQVVGFSENISGSRHAFIWTNGVGMNELVLPGDSSEAVAINNKGQVVGFYRTGDNQQHAFLWDTQSGLTEIVSPYGKSSTAKDINENGQVIGTISTPNGKEHAFIWDKEHGLTDLVGADGPSSYATGINNKGQVVGNIFVSEMNNYSGYIWDKETGLKDLKISKIESYTDKINESGQIIGYVRTGKILFIPKKSFSFIRTNFGLIVNLNKAGKLKNDIVKAEAINNSGWIAGQIDSNAMNPRYQPILLKPKKSIITELKEQISQAILKRRS